MDDDFDGLPLRGNRPRPKGSRWQADNAPQIILSSKWDNLEADAEGEPSKKKSKANEQSMFSGSDSRRAYDDDIDGVPLDDSPDATRTSSGSR